MDRNVQRDLSKNHTRNYQSYQTKPETIKSIKPIVLTPAYIKLENSNPSSTALPIQLISYSEEPVRKPVVQTSLEVSKNVAVKSLPSDSPKLISQKLQVTSEASNNSYASQKLTDELESLSSSFSSSKRNLMEFITTLSLQSKLSQSMPILWHDSIPIDSQMQDPTESFYVKSSVKKPAFLKQNLAAFQEKKPYPFLRLLNLKSNSSEMVTLTSYKKTAVHSNTYSAGVIPKARNTVRSLKTHSLESIMSYNLKMKISASEIRSLYPELSAFEKSGSSIKLKQNTNSVPKGLTIESVSSSSEDGKKIIKNEDFLPEDSNNTAETTQSIGTKSISQVIENYTPETKSVLSEADTPSVETKEFSLEPSRNSYHNFEPAISSCNEELPNRRSESDEFKNKNFRPHLDRLLSFSSRKDYEEWSTNEQHPFSSESPIHDEQPDDFYHKISTPFCKQESIQSITKGSITRTFKQQLDQEAKSFEKEMAGALIPLNRLRSSSKNKLDYSGTKEERAILFQKLQKFLKDFLDFSTRLPIKYLQDRGILQNRGIFGNSLQSNGAEIPEFLQLSIRTLESSRSFMETPHIYRQTGNLAEIQSLRFQLEEGQWDKLIGINNVHNLTGIIKLFLREVVEPTIPWDFTLMICENPDKILNNFAQMSSTYLNESHRNVLKFLLTHLNNVIKDTELNLMSASSLGIVLGPCLSWPETSSPKKILDNINKQKTSLAFLIEHTAELYRI